MLLAARLGKTLAELDASMDTEEFMLWQAFHLQYPHILTPPAVPVWPFGGGSSAPARPPAEPASAGDVNDFMRRRMAARSR